MALYKESMINKIEDDLQGRNQNWDTLETHLAESASKHITESGENANGRYIKFDDGTMIVTCLRDETVTTSIVGANINFIRLQPFSFPATFIEPPFFLGATSTDAQMMSVANSSGDNTTTSSRVNVTYRSSRTENLTSFNLTYIGKWK